MKVNRFIDEELDTQRAGLPKTSTADQGPVVNVCGLLVHAARGRDEDVARRIAEFPGVEIHAATDDGRIVVTVEDTSKSKAAEIMAAINEQPGVASTSLVYHHFEPEESMEREEFSS